jgi:hypothetical protein
MSTISRFAPGEQAAIASTLEAGHKYGFGNLISCLQAEWMELLIRNHDMTEAEASLAAWVLTAWTQPLETKLAAMTERARKAEASLRTIEIIAGAEHDRLDPLSQAARALHRLRDEARFVLRKADNTGPLFEAGGQDR